MSNRFFYSAILISLALHLAVISFLSYEREKILPKRKKTAEITYQKIKVTQSKPKPIERKPIKIEQKEESVKKEVEVLAHKPMDFNPMQPDGVKAPSRLIKDLDMEKKVMSGPENFMKERKIEVPMLKIEKITNQKYLGYNDRLHQRIQQRANEIVENIKTHAGDVYLTFVLKSDGTLLQTKIIEERSNADNYLKQLSLRIINESGPFAPFPKDLTYPELTFNIIISFK
jgi:outer membrane biosynthesis protein TonB